MNIRNDVPLSEILWYKIGGKTRYLLEATTREDVKRALDFIDKKNVKKIFVCGLGANLIFTDEYFDGAVIRIVTEEPDMHIQNNYVTSFAGTILDNVITHAFDHSLSGLEWAGGLPGTVGAGVRGNVGAYGGEIKDSIVSAEVLEIIGSGFTVRNLNNSDLQFVYRGSIVKQKRNMIVLSATFQLQKGTSDEVKNSKNIYTEHIEHRKARHPLEYPNCGSVFKNIKKPEQIAKVLEIYPDLKNNVENKWYGKVAAAALIQRFGLQGYRVGNAQVSEKHALFIVNLGGAKAKDVLTIIDAIQEKFENTFGFTLEPEVEIVQ